MLWRILLAVVRFCSWLLIRTPTRTRTRLAGRSRHYRLDFELPILITRSKPPTEKEAREHAARIERESRSLAPLDPRD
jgi:hypothetical protein